MDPRIVAQVTGTVLHERLVQRVLAAARTWRTARGPASLQGARVSGARLAAYSAAADALEAALASLDRYEKEHT